MPFLKISSMPSPPQHVVKLLSTFLPRIGGPFSSTGKHKLQHTTPVFLTPSSHVLHKEWSRRTSIFGERERKSERESERERMQPYTTNVRAEAERWLVIAEKLLEGRDLVGSKTFAIRARESGLEVADQILAVADTLIAGEKRINNQPDWYAILQLPGQTRDLEVIAAHYQRLAILLNPHRSRLAFADHAFKLVYDAWSVLSNPSKKALYDNEINLFLNLDAAAPSRSQEHHEQQHHHNWQQQPQPQQQQQQAAARQSPIDNTVNERNEIEECELPNNQDENSTFWTTCPYCFFMYEYPRVYVECSLRCQNCHRAFHAVKIQAPPPIVEGQEAYFTCWGFFPVGVSSSYLEKKKVGASNWTPFSPMFASPQGDGKNVGGRKGRGRKRGNPWKSSAPRIYIDDDDIFLEVSESSDESDDEDWGSTRRKKKAKKTRGRRSAGRNTKKQQADKGKNVEGASRDDAQGGSVMPGVMGTPTVSNAETSRQAAMTRKQKEKVPKELGKLDLNVEFSNEVEEPAPGMTQGNNNRAANGEEEGIEGIGFFEGLDEFLSSLPILNVVGDDKVKAA